MTEVYFQAPPPLFPLEHLLKMHVYKAVMYTNMLQLQYYVSITTIISKPAHIAIQGLLYGAIYDQSTELNLITLA